MVGQRGGWPDDLKKGEKQRRGDEQGKIQGKKGYWKKTKGQVAVFGRAWNKNPGLYLPGQALKKTPTPGGGVSTGRNGGGGEKTVLFIKGGGTKGKTGEEFEN